MKTFTLNNGLVIPAIGFGTYKVNSESVCMAIKAGYRYFDTASFYGTEGMIGEAISRSGMKREEFIIASKLWKTDMEYENTLRAFNLTLENLGTDYIDVFMIHWPNRKLNLETWSAMEELYSQGKIRVLGLSNFLPYHADDILNHCKVKPLIAQLEFHPGYTQTFALNYYHEKNILLQAWSPTARGRVLDDELIRELSEKYHVSPVQICLSFCIHENVMPLPKSSLIERMKENLESLNIELEREDVMRIENMPPKGWGGEHPDRERVRVV